MTQRYANYLQAEDRQRALIDRGFDGAFVRIYRPKESDSVAEPAPMSKKKIIETNDIKSNNLDSKNIEPETIELETIKLEKIDPSIGVDNTIAPKIESNETLTDNLSGKNNSEKLKCERK